MTSGSSSGRPTAGVAAVHDRVRRAILAGQLEPGSVVAQGALGEAFDAGRTPLREAIRILQREGLVIAEPNRSVRIAPLSAEDLEQIWIARVALESLAARLTVPTLTSADVADLEGVMAQMDHYARTDDREGFRRPHREFHRRIVGGAGARVGAEIATLTDHTERYRWRVLDVTDPTPWTDIQVSHRAILDAAAAGAAAGAASRLVEHYATNAAVTFDVIDPEYDPKRLREAVAAVAPGAITVLR